MQIIVPMYFVKAEGKLVKFRIRISCIDRVNSNRAMDGVKL